MPCWKLVRDKIPEILQDRNTRRDNIIIQKHENPQELELLLRAKIVEEAAELAETGNIEEAADLLEALYHWLHVKNHTIQELEKTRKEKKEKLGGFTKGYVIIWLDRETC